MALVSVGWRLSVTLSDQGGNKSVLKYDLVAADAAAAAAAATTVLAELDPVTDAAIVGYFLGEQFQDDAVYFGLGEVEEIASISARIESNQAKYANVKIPAPAAGIFKAASGDDWNNVDPADADLVSYLQLWQDGSNVALLSDGETLRSPGAAGNVTGKRIHRASRKG